MFLQRIYASFRSYTCKYAGVHTHGHLGAFTDFWRSLYLSATRPPSLRIRVLCRSKQTVFPLPCHEPSEDQISLTLWTRDSRSPWPTPLGDIIFCIWHAHGSEISYLSLSIASCFAFLLRRKLFKMHSSTSVLTLLVSLRMRSHHHIRSSPI